MSEISEVCSSVGVNSQTQSRSPKMPSPASRDVTCAPEHSELRKPRGMESGDNEDRSAMKVDKWLKSNVSDGRELLDSGYEGAHRAVKEVLHAEEVQSDLTHAAHN